MIGSRSSLRAPAALVVLLAVSLAFAEDARADDAIKVELVGKAQEGGDPPALVVRALVPVRKLRLDVKRKSDGKRLDRSAGPVFGGREHRFALLPSEIGRA